VPRVSVWLVRAALLHLAGGFLIGAVLLADRGVSFAPALWSLRPLHVEMLLVGWTMQLVMGVAIWIFPRFALRQAPRRSAVTAWLVLILLNGGVALVGAGAVVAGRLLEAAAAGSFALHLWRRVAPSGLSAM
jgi:hypothetical protein